MSLPPQSLKGEWLQGWAGGLLHQTCRFGTCQSRSLQGILPLSLLLSSLPLLSPEMELDVAAGSGRGRGLKVAMGSCPSAQSLLSPAQGFPAGRFQNDSGGQWNLVQLASSLPYKPSRASPCQSFVTEQGALLTCSLFKEMLGLFAAVPTWRAGTQHLSFQQCT